MKTIYEDSIEPEPLRLRFVIDGTPTPERCDDVARFVVDWMQEQERSHHREWRFCEYRSQVLPSGVVEVFCELMPIDFIMPLARAVESSFPFLSEMRIGEKEAGSALLEKIDWVEIPSGAVTIDGVSTEVDAFTINFTSITVGQFCEFLDATGYVPVPDRLRGIPGVTISDFKLNFGKSPKIPLFGITYDDAVAFADWAGFRLPTDAELRLFYEVAMIQMKRKVNWDGDTWTSTPAGPDKFYVRRGPYHEVPSPTHDPNRKPLNRNHYEQLEAPSIRIVKLSE